MQKDDKEIRKKYEAFKITLLATFKEHFPEATVTFPGDNSTIIKKIPLDEVSRATIEEQKIKMTEDLNRIAEEKAKKAAEEQARLEAEAEAKRQEEIQRQIDILEAKKKKIVDKERL